MTPTERARKIAERYPLGAAEEAFIAEEIAHAMANARMEALIETGCDRSEGYEKGKAEGYAIGYCAGELAMRARFHATLQTEDMCQECISSVGRVMRSLTFSDPKGEK